MSGGDELPRVLYVAGHSHGTDHISRMAAIAARSVVDVRPYIVTTADPSSAWLQLNLAFEHFPQAHWLRVPERTWDDVFGRRLVNLAHELDAAVIAVDDDRLARILAREADALPNTETVRLVAGAQHEYDDPRAGHVIESAELASVVSGGHGIGRRHIVKPILPVDPADMFSHGLARRFLGLPRDEPAVLVSMSQSPEPRVIERIRDVVHERNPNAVVFVVGDAGDVSGVVTRPVPAIMRCLHAFDAAISYAGYYDLHQIVAAGVPAVFVPDPARDPDPQAMRAKLAASLDVGSCVDDPWSPEFASSVRDVLDPAVARRMRTAAVHVHPGNGTTEAAHIIAALALGVAA